jgi:glycerophosphoryl diester phosphodiesterase
MLASRAFTGYVTVYDLLSALAVPFAHRGLHGPGAPENSLAAFAGAVQAGLGVELDVRLSADGVPMVHHDATLLRSCGVQRRVHELTAAELSALELSGGGGKIPTLAEALRLIDGRAPLLLDLKAPTRPIARRRLVDGVARNVRGYQGPVGVVGFDPWVLNAVAVRVPGLAIGQTGGVPLTAIQGRWWLRPAVHPVDALWSRRLSRPHFLLFNVHRLPSAPIARLRRELPVVAWTVRTAEDYALARAHADGVIVEDAAVALASADAELAV